MTPNEKKALVKFKAIKEGNTVAIAATLRVTINYAGDVCKKLCKKGYLERLLPGMFARYKITPRGEEQVKGEGVGEEELRNVVGAEEEGKEAIEERDEYECVSCGAVVKENDTECLKCGVVFEEVVEEEVAEESPAEPTPEEAPSLAPQGSKVSEEAENLNQPSAPEDWKRE